MQLRQHSNCVKMTVMFSVKCNEYAYVWVIRITQYMHAQICSSMSLHPYINSSFPLIHRTLLTHHHTFPWSQASTNP